jgi:PleD family two-component response regulator
MIEGKAHYSVGKSIDALNALAICAHRSSMLLTRSMLAMAGVNSVVAFESPLLALNHMIHYPVDLVMIEAECAPISGLQFVRAMRHCNAAPLCFIPVILTSSRPTPHYVSQALKAGAQLVLHRPFSTSILRDRLLWALNDKRRMYLKDDHWRIEGVDELMQRNAQNKLLPVLMMQLGLSPLKPKDAQAHAESIFDETGQNAIANAV